MIKELENTYEHIAWQIDQTVIGIDEAGRGPIAGPLVVAGVILPIGYENPEIYDSKQTSLKKREELYNVIIENALSYQIVIVSEKEVDELNIYRATQKAMHEIGESLESTVVLTDAMPLPHCSKVVHDIIKGDQKSTSIAAASILAKVTRDRIMIELDKQYPEYGFARHKGYPTKEHLENLKKFGVLEIHRKSYGPVQDQMQMQLDI